MMLGTGLFFIFGLIVLANAITAAGNPIWSRLFIWLLLLANVPVFLFGLGIFLLPPETLSGLPAFADLLLLDWQAAGLSFMGMGAWGMAVSLPPVRRLLARVLPSLNADSAIQALGLVFSGYLVGNTVFSLTQGGLEELAETAVAASIYDILLMQALFAGTAVLGVGLYTRRSSEETRRRLGLERPTRHQLLIGVVWIFGLVAIQAVTGAIWTLLDSSQAELLEGISSELFGNIDTLGEWLLLAAATGFGEELLFRGAIQPVFGIGGTAFLFATAHIQYGITPITLVVFIIGIILGIIRRRYNTTTAIFVHSGYNLVLGLLSLFALQLENMVG